MAEAFGVAAGALGFLGVIDASMSIGGTILEYVKEFRDANNEQRRLVGELTVFQAILPLVKQKLKDVESSDNAALVAAARALEVESGPLEAYQSSLVRIGKELEKARLGSTASQAPSTPSAAPSRIASKPKWWRLGSSKLKTPAPQISSPPTPTSTLRQRLAWPNTLDDINEDLGRIERFQSSVTLILTAGAPAAREIAKKLNALIKLNIKNQVDAVGYELKEVLEDLDGVGKQLEVLVLDMNEQQRLRIANWLSDVKSATPLFEATPGTGKWFLTSETFTNWETGAFRVLYCPGDPGTGKTTLMTIALRHLDDKYIKDRNRITIRFLFNYKESAEMTMSKLVAFILTQLIRHRALSATTTELLDFKVKSVRPSKDKILALLSDEIGSYDRVFLVLDALDESPNDMSAQIRRFLIDHLPENVSLLCTSRRIPKIMDAVAPGERVVDLTSHVEDMKKYIDAVFSDPGDGEFREVVARTKDVDQDSIRSRVLERARRMFLLVRLMMVRLKAQCTPKDLKDALDTLPSGLYEMYEQMIQRSPNPDCTLRLLCWATSPLGEEDLESAARLLYKCGGMVEVRKRENVAWNGSKLERKEVSEVFFTHYTTQEYITNLLEPTHKYLNHRPDFVRHLLTQADIARLCVQYIQHHLTSIALLPEPSLLRYCVRYWPYHATYAVDDGKLNAAALDLLNDEEKLKLLNTMIDAGGRTGLHIVAEAGLYLLAVELCRWAPETLDAVWDRGKTPLHIASREGHVRVAAVLLDQNKGNAQSTAAAPSKVSARVDVNAKDSADWRPIHWAAYNGHLGVVKLLMAAEGIDVKARTDTGATPLHFAAQEGALEVVDFLYTIEDVESNVKDHLGQTPLHLARKVEWSAKDKDGRTPPHLAAQYSRLEVVQLFSMLGVDLNARDVRGRTPLHLAAAEGRLEAVKLLSTLADVDLNARDDDGRTPLHRAAAPNSSHIGLETFEALAEVPGVDVHAKDNEGITPLQVVATRRRDVDREMRGRRTPTTRSNSVVHD